MNVISAEYELKYEFNRLHNNDDWLLKLKNMYLYVIMLFRI